MRNFLLTNNSFQGTKVKLNRQARGIKNKGMKLLFNFATSPTCLKI